ncbi:GIY-YIG nuclease family protein [Patescibacteria group bacterium]|nr:GIY-YIG nuclease family protein [Patescibacteria group bacterium]MBU1705519.1 GIY-YIG nuclease family protein [Patescibacteria group bacterium]
MHYTYVLKCCEHKLYIGSSSNLRQRIDEHQRRDVSSTRNRRPVQLIYYEACLNKQLALAREKYFKTGFGRSFLNKRIFIQ